LGALFDALYHLTVLPLRPNVNRSGKLVALADCAGAMLLDANCVALPLLGFGCATITEALHCGTIRPCQPSDQLASTTGFTTSAGLIAGAISSDIWPLAGQEDVSAMAGCAHRIVLPLGPAVNFGFDTSAPAVSCDAVVVPIAGFTAAAAISAVALAEH